MLLQAFLLLVSIVGLYYGAEFALEAAEKVGQHFGLSPLVIGLLIVGFGTSLPEFFVSQLACFRNHSEIALGNIVGSNIANLFLILGISGLFVPLHIWRSDIKRQLVIHLFITLVLVGVLTQPKFYKISSIVLIIFFGGYLYNTFLEMKRHKAAQEVVDSEEKPKLGFKIILELLIGFVLLYAGGELLVYSGTNLGRELGITEYVLSAIFVAFGTSFPELVTALLAIHRKKDPDFISGNIIGSNIFNVGFVLGSLGFYNFDINTPFQVELVILVGAALFMLALSQFKKNFYRFGGSVFLASYFGVVAYWIR